MGDSVKLAGTVTGAASLVSLGLTACGSSSSSSSSTGGGSNAHVDLKVLLANHTPYYAMITPTFEQQNNATISFTNEQFALISAKLATAFASGGQTWDVVYIWRAWVEQFKKYLTPLSDLGYTPDSSDMLSVAIEAGKAADGKWYGTPSNTYTYVLYYNKGMLQAAGISPPATYADFVAAAHELTSGNKFGYTDGWAVGYLFPKWCVWLHLNGGSLYGSNGEVKFNTDQAKQATADMKALLPSMPPQVATSPWGIYDVEAKKVFYSGQAAMIIDYQHPWYESADPSVSPLGAGAVGAQLIPGKTGMPASATQAVGECFAIPQTSPNKQRALALLQYYSNAKNQLGLLTQRTQLHQFNAAGEDGYPAYKSDYSDSSIPSGDHAFIQTTLQQQSYKHDRYGTRPAYQKIADTIEAAVSSVLLGQSDVSSAHSNAQSALDSIVAAEKAGQY
jgi:multiple sugar transport system substrate-binding protein